MIMFETMRDHELFYLEEYRNYSDLTRPQIKAHRPFQQKSQFIFL